MMKRVELDFQQADEERENCFIARAGLFSVVSLLGGQRGEEIPLLLQVHFISLNNLLKKHYTPHWVIA